MVGLGVLVGAVDGVFVAVDAGSTVDVAAIVQPLVEKNGNQLVIACPDGLGEMHADQTKPRLLGERGYPGCDRSALGSPDHPILPKL